MYKREEKERDGELWERPSTLTSFHGREKEKKIPNYLEVRRCPKQKANMCIKEQDLSRSNIHDSYPNFK